MSNRCRSLCLICNARTSLLGLTRTSSAQGHQSGQSLNSCVPIDGGDAPLRLDTAIKSYQDRGTIPQHATLYQIITQPSHLVSWLAGLFNTVSQLRAAECLSKAPAGGVRTHNITAGKAASGPVVSTCIITLSAHPQSGFCAADAILKP